MESDLEKQLEGILVDMTHPSRHISTDEHRAIARQQAIRAIKQLIVQARIEETNLWYHKWGYGDEQIGDGSWEDFYEHRIAQLKGESKDEHHRTYAQNR